MQCWEKQFGVRQTYYRMFRGETKGPKRENSGDFGKRKSGKINTGLRI